MLDSSGRCLGLICALTKRPLPDAKLAEVLLKTFATRAAIELERKNYEDALAHSEERFRAFVVHGNEGVLWIQIARADFNGRCPRMSRSNIITATRTLQTATIRRRGFSA